MASLAYLPTRAPEASTRQVSLQINEVLEKIPSIFGRLERVAEIVTPDLAAICISSDILALLDRLHHRIFLDWLSKPMAFRVSDLGVHFRRMKGEGLQAYRLLQTITRQEALLPRAASDAERSHFLMDFECILPIVADRLDYPMNS